MSRMVNGLAVAFSVAAFTVSSADAALIGHWTFEGNATNSGTLGATNDGTIHGGVTFVEGPNGFGQAAKFDGTTGYILIENSQSGPLDLVGTSFTYATWAKAEVGARIGRAIQKDDGGDYSGGYQFGFNDGSFNYVTHNPGGGNLNVGALPTDGEWHHYAVRYDLTNQKLDFFVDGVLTATFAPLTPLTSDGNDYLRFGAGAFDKLQPGQEHFGFQGFNGAMDDVRIYDEALSDQAIAALIPEPASLMLLGAGAAMMLRRRR